MFLNCQRLQRKHTHDWPCYFYCDDCMSVLSFATLPFGQYHWDCSTLQYCLGLIQRGVYGCEIRRTIPYKIQSTDKQGAKQYITNRGNVHNEMNGQDAYTGWMEKCLQGTDGQDFRKMDGQRAHRGWTNRTFLGGRNDNVFTKRRTKRNIPRDRRTTACCKWTDKCFWKTDGQIKTWDRRTGDQKGQADRIFTERGARWFTEVEGQMVYRSGGPDGLPKRRARWLTEVDGQIVYRSKWPDFSQK